MKKIILAGVACFCLLTSMIAIKETGKSTKFSDIATATNASSFEVESYWIDSLYSGMNLSGSGLSKQVFFNACKGYEYLLLQNAIRKPGILTICDYSQCSNKKRLYVLDLNAEKILFNTYVSHGRNSGDQYATSFSNSNDSHKSSLGFMITAETYKGDNGYSMRLDGMETGFNDNVRMRSIVMHGCQYVNNQRVAQGTMMGRSYGCPAVPSPEVHKIIDRIKDGSCFFNFYPDNSYTKNSKILNADFVWPVAQTMQVAFVKLPDTSASNRFPAVSLN